MRIAMFGGGLVIVGILIFVYPDLNFLPNKQAGDIASIKINKNEGHLTQWPRVTGIVLVLSGIAFTWKGKRRLT